MDSNAMTDQERARALSGATRECRTFYNAMTGPECPDCQGTGRVFVLDDRARRECPGRVVTVAPYRDAEELHDEQCCGGSGWLTTLLEEPEPCRERHNIEVSSSRCKACGVWQTDPPGTIVRPDTDRIITVLEAAGYAVTRGPRHPTATSGGVALDCWIVTSPNGEDHGHDTNILVAACKALGSEEPCQPR